MRGKRYITTFVVFVFDELQFLRHVQCIFSYVFVLLNAGTQ